MFLLSAARFACHHPFTQCPVSEVRAVARHPRYELRKQEGHWQISNFSAACRFEVPDADSWRSLQELQIGGTG